MWPFKPSPRKQRSNEIQTLLKRAVRARGYKVVHVAGIGYQYDSAFWIFVKTDAERDKLRNDKEMAEQLSSLFEKTGYTAYIRQLWAEEINDPKQEDLKQPHIVFESRETVKRDNGGNYCHAMK